MHKFGRKNQKLIFTNGCFDILHIGHVELLNYCSTLGYVVVGLNSDLSVSRLKGSGRPINKVRDRERLLLNLRSVNKVIVFNENNPLELIKRLKPDIIVKGGDYSAKEVIGSELAEIRVFQFIEGYSSTSIINKINFLNKKKPNG